MKYQLYKKRIHFFILFLVTTSIFSQQSIIDTHTQAQYNHALKLYNNNAYSAAQRAFSNISDNKTNFNLKSNIAFYDAMCSIKLNQKDAEKKVSNFVNNYPTSLKKNSAFFNVGDFYFKKRKASRALKWFRKIDESELSNELKKEVNFKMGYGLLTSQKLELAKARFSTLLSDEKYGNDSRYYYGFIAYKLKDYDVAESTLKDVTDNKSYKNEISYYLLDINFKQGRFEQCIVDGQQLLKTIGKREHSEVKKIIGESYFNLKKYEEAIPYLRAFKGRKGKWNNTDYYQLGYAYYKLNDFENAVNNFNKITSEKNSIAQNAYYHLGESYLYLEKKAEALNAFKTASEMDFNKTIKEDAALNYAKLSYEQGNPFKSVAEVLQDYLKAYPKSKHYTEINNLVITSYIHQQNFEGALNYLDNEKRAKKTSKIQEISLYRGIQLFNENKFAEALPYFVKSEKSSNSKISNTAHYWKAETNYRLQNFKESLQEFNTLKNLLTSKNKIDFPLVDYNIGYSYFKLKEYEKSSKAFEDYLKNEVDDTTVKNDALIRLGDSYFALKEYAKSIKTYEKVANQFTEGSDYAQYQIGMGYGFINDNDIKIDALKKVVNNYTYSSLKDDALYQLANTYTKIKDHENAHHSYNRILEKHPRSVFIPKVLVRQGLLFYNDNENKKALEKFKRVTREFPNSSDAFEAVANAKNIYIDDGNIDDFINWTNTLKFINISDSDLDNTSFQAAEKKYLESGNLNEVVRTLKSYNQNFPNGIFKLKANFYLGETLFKDKLFNEAISAYKIVLEAEQSEYSEESLNKLSQIYLTENDFNNALPLLNRLEQEAYSKQNILYAQSNLMKGYYKTEAYDLAVEYAEKLLAKKTLDNSLKFDATVTLARSFFEKNDLDKSKKYYKEVEKEATGKLKAEALYFNAFFKNQSKEFTASNKIIQKLIADYSTYKYWGVKSYVIMAKNYYQLKDTYQATYILENIISNFIQFEDIIEEAKSELVKIKSNEAKTNTSINSQNKN